MPDSLSRVAVAVETPRHSAVGGLLDYTSERPLAPGTLLRVPLGRREVPGIAWDAGTAEGAADGVEPAALRPVLAALDSLPPLDAHWRALVGFAAGYYQRGIGELALAVLPPGLPDLDDPKLARRLARLSARPASAASAPVEAPVEAPDLSDEQAQALAALRGPDAGRRPVLLHGVTGSGKTEVYLRAAADALAASAEAGGRRQVLVLVPEINLTPQLEARFAARFPGHTLVSLHSGLTPAQRLSNWLQAHLGHADLVLGTRLAVFASMPNLGLIVVDEEHDPSFKQQEGARYSARDLAVWRAHDLGIPVMLGSATPSLETWQRVREGKYRRLMLASRIGGGVLPRVRIADMGALPYVKGQELVLAPAVLDALKARLARGEQSLVLLNRRGYAPVLHCTACDWKSGCPHCSAWRVFHKSDRSLRCHHCGFTERVPRACPECGNLDIAPIGRGTEKLEEQLGALLPGARLLRFDADTTRGAGKLQQQLGAVHAGEVDVLVGTQILAKGHDFRRVTLVIAVNPDGALFSSDFRAPERLFALLMQAAGRAGRDAAQAESSEVWVQTWHPRHALYGALRAHDFEAFASAQLAERGSAGLPPYSSLALVRAESRDAAVAAAFLREAGDRIDAASGVTVYSAVPPPISRVAGIERMQMLLESRSRPALQAALAAWLPGLHELRRTHKGLARWAVDVDPIAI